MFFLTFLAALNFCAHADTITLSTTNLGSASFDIPTNVVAQVVHSSSTATYKINVTINGQTTTYGQSSSAPYQVANLPTIAGPATITLVNTYGSLQATSLAICTIQTSPILSTLPSSPSTAVVIPNDNGGPVTIVLESSTDLINWTAALPGTYGTTSTNRFFRVRATR